MAIHLGGMSPCPSRNPPGRRRENPPVPPTPEDDDGTAVPTRSCSRWGLPCPPRRRRGGALLPHPFTLTGRFPPARRRGQRYGGLLSVALSL